MTRNRELGSRLAAQISLRLPEELRRLVDEAAGKNGRSKNTEIIMRLEESFAGDRPPSHAGLDDIKRELETIKAELARTQDMIQRRK